MPTIRDIINQVQLELGLGVSANIVGSSDRLTLQLSNMLERLAAEIKSKTDWPELTAVSNFTMFATSLTGDIADGAVVITGISDTSDLQVGFTVNGDAFLSTSTSQGDSVRIVSVDSATQVTVSRAASEASTGGTFVFAQDRYSLPDNFDKQQFDTFWQQSQRWKLIGPLSPAEWELRKNGIVAGYPIKRFRVFGQQDAKLNIDASPALSDNGQMIVFEYLTRNTFRPAAWAASTAYAADAYCSRNGNIYQTTSGGTSGSTPPTHFSGSVSDGGVTWTYFGAPYDQIHADTDTCVFDRDVVEPGLKYMFSRAKRLKYDDYEIDYRRALDAALTKLRGAGTLNMAGQVFTRFIDGASIPDTGYGAGYP